MLSWRRWLWIATAVLFVASARDALAHRVNVFAYVEGDTVHVECSYSRSDRVRLGEISVQNAATGQVYLTGTTDERGDFAFAVPPEARGQKADLRILLKAGEGHQNDWVVKAEEYAAAAAAPAPTAPAGSALDPAKGGGPATPAAPPAVAPAKADGPDRACLEAAALGPVIEAAVEAAVEKKIAPLRKMLLDDKEKGPGLAEIFGGIGWLVGLAGLAAYGKSRKAGKGA
ncbi:MAG: hypothetical protein AAGU21_18300 [Solidesulfovibrio sp.]|uniref:hypothetical protein n=1 Tax=Solidesulfovibrio sp. TaxID=2910990 RepID=UPI002B20CD73|nr:hypothetical protein [Solidesulfovibrio sp.]MEA4855779.1 hypothetical protein [Solidesulfovibrio sp.]